VGRSILPQPMEATGERKCVRGCGLPTERQGATSQGSGSPIGTAFMPVKPWKPPISRRFYDWDGCIDRTTQLDGSPDVRSGSKAAEFSPPDCAPQQRRSGSPLPPDRVQQVRPAARRVAGSQRWTSAALGVIRSGDRGPRGERCQSIVLGSAPSPDFQKARHGLPHDTAQPAIAQLPSSSRALGPVQRPSVLDRRGGRRLQSM
jgi:hypothetical protein